MSRLSKIVRKVRCSHTDVQENSIEEYGIIISEIICKCGKLIEKTVSCTDCNGRGIKDVCYDKFDGFTQDTCPKCKGTGKIDYEKFIKVDMPPLRY